MNKNKRLLTLSAILLLAVPLLSISAFAIGTGAILKNIKVRDAKNNPAWIPNFGKKVLIILYNDVDVADQNDPFANTMKAAKITGNNYQAIGIANMKDAPWKPNSVIRYMARRKIKQYPGTVILTDPEYILRDAWGLGNCNQKSVLIVIGKDKKVHYYKKGKLSDAESQEALAIIQKLVQ